jgi:hypothetical protein
MLTLLTGALAGLVHVFAGPDHLAAVAPLALAERRQSWVAGWTWGLGHTSGVVVVAAVAILLRDQLPPVAVISAWGERIVGAALLAIGFWALRRSARLRTSAHAHGSVSHNHLHLQAGPAWMRRLGHAHASFYMGILHGVAGSSHFLGVLPALALPTRGASLLYIGAFGAGTVAAMTAFAAAVGFAGLRVPLHAAAHRAMMLAASVAAIAVGGWWLLAL